MRSSIQFIPSGFSILKVNAFLFILGLGWLFMMGYSPFRSILWDEALWKGLIESVLGYNWSDYVTSDLPIRMTAVLEVVFIFMLAFAGLFTWQVQIHWARWVILLTASFLVVFAIWDWRSHSWRIPQILEHAARAGSLFLILGAFYWQWSKARLIRISEWLIGATFVGHGLFALGWWPRPGHFVDMTILLLNCSESQAVFFLQIVGWLDLISALIVLMQWPGTKVALWYMIIWGLATAIARIASNYYAELASEQLMRWLPEVLIRTPHYLLPLFVVLASGEASNKAASNTSTG
ncbi:MAG: hypothetical protein AAF598_07080 [Bacteroidota bacterium]